jgi:hypothetical protein
MRVRTGLVTAVAVLLACGAMTSAAMAVTPGWECVPTSAGLAVTSGGTAASPTCPAKNTAVLAPTYVSAGVDGKPTVQFSTVNVQVVSGSGSTSGTVNGKGNVIIGYAEDVNKHSQAGSNDLILGTNNGWTGYGQLVDGSNNQATGDYAAAFGVSNVASGEGSLVAGHDNSASGGNAVAIGGSFNQATGSTSSVTGGQFNKASDPYASVDGGCDNVAGSATAESASCSATGAEAVLGGGRPGRIGRPRERHPVDGRWWLQQRRDRRGRVRARRRGQRRRRDGRRRHLQPDLERQHRLPVLDDPRR